MEARAARRAHSARVLLTGGGAATGPGPGLGPGAAGSVGGARGWDAPGAPWRWRWRRLRAEELAPRRGEPVEPGRRAEAAAQAQRRPQPESERRAPTMAAQSEPGYLAAHSDPGSNSERSTDSPMPGSEDDLVAGAPLHSPECSEERFRVDRKKLEAMLQGRHPPAFLDSPIESSTFPRTSPSTRLSASYSGPQPTYFPGLLPCGAGGQPRERRPSGTRHPSTPLRSLGTGNPGLTSPASEKLKAEFVPARPRCVLCSGDASFGPDTWDVPSRSSRVAEGMHDSIPTPWQP